MSAEIKLVPLSSLSKVFLDREPEHKFYGGSMLRNEKYSFQIAFSSSGVQSHAFSAKLKIDSPLKDYISARVVGNLPSITPVYPGRYDDFYISTKPGLFPDPLYEIENNEVKVLQDKWQSIWFTIEGDKKKLPPGKYPVYITIYEPEMGIESTTSIELEVINACLPEQKLIYTNWFHCDCIASIYKCEIFSEKHWNLIEKFISVAAQNGMNMILTPAFTPPLDTKIGEERATVQLVDVYKNGSNYHFKFDKLDRWIDICLKNGIHYFEHSHLFTQWGAKHAPKIMGYEDGDYKRLFGWDTPASCEGYINFLHQYLPSVISFLKEKGVDQRTYFHISDEPSLDDLESYAKAKEIIKDKLQGYKIFDALSNYTFYEKGIVFTPVVDLRHIQQFIGKVDDLWAYYTGNDCTNYLPNRLFSMPSLRNRILGSLMYKYDIKGFLQWAYNFYYTKMCEKECNPFVSTDAFGDFPSGTAFMVYPGVDGPIESLRLIVFNEGLQDMRAMQLLESFVGKDNVLEIIEKDIHPITFAQYPREDKYLLDMRDRINHEIARHLDAD